MKIKSISAKDNRTGWNVENIQFNYMLTLLVGASGVGKTKILNVIKTLVKIAKGESVNAFEWKVSFLQDGHDYVWEGAFETITDANMIVLEEKENKRFNIIKEIIIDDNTVLVDRNDERLLYKNQELVKLDNTKSVVELLKNESSLMPIYNGFRQCYDLDATDTDTITISTLNNDDIKNEFFVRVLKELNILSPLERLFVLHENNLNEYNLICQKFQEIFPSVEKIGFTMIKKYGNINMIILRIKEKNIPEWIDQQEISSGMFRTLMQITTLVLANDGDVIMIDEFENGLGVNCINELADLIMDPETDVQVIMTSHHPYIINAIPVNDWKILTRNGCDVHVHTAEQLNIGEHSKHEAFMQLLQTPEYKTGQNRN